MQLPFGGEGDDDNGGKKRRRGRSALPYSDIDLKNWQSYPDIWTDSLWIVPSRAKGSGHRLDYFGNFVPQIANQIYRRFSRKGDIVLDLFLGSGTSAVEAQNLGRRLVGVEISQEQCEKVKDKLGPGAPQQGIEVICGDSSSRRILQPVTKSLDRMGASQVQLLVLHPPYHDIIQFTEDRRDLSNCDSTTSFLRAFRRVAKIGYDLLEPGRFAVLVIGDKYADKELVPLGFLTMQEMNRIGFRTKSIIVKNMVGNERGKGRANNLWRYRALAGGFYIFKHEYVMVFFKEG